MLMHMSATSGWAEAAEWIQVAASLLSIVLALVGLVIAWEASRDQKHSRDFAFDRGFLDDFERDIADIYSAQLLGPPAFPGEGSASLARQRLNQAVYRFMHRVSGTRAGFVDLLVILDANISTIGRLHDAGVLHDDDGQQVGQALIEMRQGARDWVYPERRRSVLVKGYHLRMNEMPDYRDADDRTRDLAIDRWLLNDDPAPLPSTRAWRNLHVRTRGLIADIRARRLRLLWWNSVLRRRDHHEWLRKHGPLPRKPKHPRYYALPVDPTVRAQEWHEYLNPKDGPQKRY